ncbi:PLC-like phosphodiesterase [Piromyces finnis]|uniref:PLC-like phosphodiesterase n=1 Tax=Piromyces finnis TaxID=1754191 RepID=A0A1Y1UD97_9FUNG|nr:PLC-like phosphodiesterase [Piromyces finnis]|eukprot:ORX35517.1 PLC-like phosphodiesterase [Piromyces finnis]
MKLTLLFINTLFISIKYVLSAKDEGKYFELDNVDKEAYLFSLKDCSKTYICTKRDKGFLRISDDIYGCYYKTEKVDGEFGQSTRVDPDQCQFKGRVNIKEGFCYYTSNGGETTSTKKIKLQPNVLVYDIDVEYNRALTEYGWCDFTYADSDSNWMSKYLNNTRINQINIPGTHDSGTYAVDWHSFPIINGFRRQWGRTQSLDIYQQLMHGIRYLDIRLETNPKKQIYLTHDKFDCINKKTNDLYYLSNVFDEAINFLHYNPSETVIMHLKCDNCHFHKYNKDGSMKEKGDLKEEEFYEAIANLSINNSDRPYEKFYKDYFYQDNKSNELFPTLGKARGTIIIYTRGDYKYTKNNQTIQIGKKIDIPGMGSCDDLSWVSYMNFTYPATEVSEIRRPSLYNSNVVNFVNNFHEGCFPRIKISDYGNNYLVQDNYNAGLMKNGLLLKIC